MIVTIILALLFGLILIVGAAYLSFNGRINREISGLLAGANGGGRVVVTEEMIKNLPAPVQKYMMYSGIAGKAIPRTVRLKQTGRIRQGAKSSWMKLEAEEYYSTNPPGFVWKAFLPGRRFPVTLGRDAYLDGRGSMLIKMLSLFPLAKAIGSEIDQGAMMRYLNEMSWFPAAFLGSNVSWKAVDETSAEITLTHQGQSVSAIMYFAEDGRPVNFVAKRYRMVGKKYDLETWSTPFIGYGEFEGLKLPVRGQGVWNLKDGDFAYVELEVTELHYD
ncbi:MAG: hypothetical protein A2W03_04820 [Candidatus Aminicenantes bacterium RBG_16_63_16]|nr:MAG: hypothetical protein A2W03_04820 [Candidatus Aminicenantes bacterium RBG_16_63_16]